LKEVLTSNDDLWPYLPIGVEFTMYGFPLNKLDSTAGRDENSQTIFNNIFERSVSNFMNQKKRLKGFYNIVLDKLHIPYEKCKRKRKSTQHYIVRMKTWLALREMLILLDVNNRVLYEDSIFEEPII
jgi:hypothetical protein